ncbi:MAG: response regulator [Dehalococcoidales bacterium]|nr:response regulator [Dehalococcoidales bacterium]
MSLSTCKSRPRSSFRHFKCGAGEEAILVAIKEQPDLIIMDIQLPRTASTDVARRFRQLPEFANTPIIALTAHAIKGNGARFDVVMPGMDGWQTCNPNRDVSDAPIIMLTGEKNPEKIPFVGWRPVPMSIFSPSPAWNIISTRLIE